MKTSSNTKNVFNLVIVLKGVLSAYLYTIILFIILGLVLYLTKISEDIIPVAVVIISAVSILLGGTKATNAVENMGWLHGGIIGFLYMLILLILNILIVRSVSVGWNVVVDLILGFIVGIISGIIGVNI